MKLLIFLIFALIGAVFCNYDSDIIESKFQLWMREHKRQYDSELEYKMRLAIFGVNAWNVDQHNKGDNSYELELNEFSDMTYEEFSKKYLITAPQKCSATKGNHKVRASGVGIPKAVDWRKRGVVSGVKNQGHCGSCWTFSTTGAMESHMAISYHRMFNLSEQQLVDCAQAFNNHGCEGGLPSQAFEYIHYNKGLETEKSYPYTAKDGHCKFHKDAAVAFVSNVVNITQYDEDQLMDAVAMKGPVSIAFDVAKDFPGYKKGVYKSHICHKDPMHVNHAVLVVGYNETEQGEKYWIVKNSWGTKFGMKGYFWIERGTNMCGLSDCASYPVVSNKP